MAIIVGFGLGGEWSAGAVLVAESWPPRHRAKAIALMQSGWALGLHAGRRQHGFHPAALRMARAVSHRTLPALLTIWIQRKVKEPPLWKARRPRVPGWISSVRRSPGAPGSLPPLATCMLFAYWGLNTWLPGFLSAPRSQGGAG
jgi:MFS family permease